MYTLTTEPFYDTYSQCYKNVIIINMLPNGPLRALVRRIQMNNKLGPNRSMSNCDPVRKCQLALIGGGLGAGCGGGGGGGKCGNWMTPNEIPDLFSFLTRTGYTIDTSITNMMSFGDVKLDHNRKILCFITYNKNELNS